MAAPSHWTLRPLIEIRCESSLFRDLMAGLSMGLGCDDRSVGVALRQRVWIGIDVSKTSHHVCTVDDHGKSCWSGRIGNDQRSIESVIDRARQTATELRWAIDLTSPLAALLITVLLAAGEQVAYVPGRMVSAMTGVFRGGGKTDAKDARVIADWTWTARSRTSTDRSPPGSANTRRRRSSSRCLAWARTWAPSSS